MNQFSIAIRLAVLLTLASSFAAADDLKPTVDRDKQALASLQEYVGRWRGVGQERRGSSRGAWQEAADWSWHFTGGRASLVATLTDGKYFSRLELLPSDAAEPFELLATPPDIGGEVAREPLRYRGKKDGDALVLTAPDAPAGLPARVTIRIVAKGDRMVVLYEKRLGDDVYTRLGEVGSTRVGSAFATAAASGPECVVTGGLGTIAVEYEGRKYFVCCSGCRDLFAEDPASVLADYHQRKAREKQQRQQND